MLHIVRDCKHVEVVGRAAVVGADVVLELGGKGVVVRRAHGARRAVDAVLRKVEQLRVVCGGCERQRERKKLTHGSNNTMQKHP